MITAKQFIKKIDEEGQEWSDDTEVMASYFEDYAKLYNESEVKKFHKPDVIRRLPTAEDVKRWYQLLVGINEDAMQKDMEATFV